MSEIEEQILVILREFKPYEKVEIIKDAAGRIDSYIIVRTQKVVLTPRKIPVITPQLA